LAEGLTDAVAGAEAGRRQQQKGLSMDSLRDSLLQRSFLFDDPESYAAGVTDALEALRSDRLGETEPTSPPPQPSPLHPVQDNTGK
jgi:hypothetical protein